MTDLIAGSWFVMVLAILAAASLFVMLRLLAQRLFNRLRLLKHIDNDGAREAMLEERVRVLTGCVDLITDIETVQTEQQIFDSVLAHAARVLSADGIAVKWRTETWIGPRGSLSDELEGLLEGAVQEPGSPETEHVMKTELCVTASQETCCLVAARVPSGAAFTQETSMSLHGLTAALRLAVSRLDALRRCEADRDLTELSEEAMRRAKLILARTQKLGLQGELAHHLVRELTGPMTGVVGLAQFLSHQSNVSYQEEVEELASESLRCRRILEQFAAASLADVGQQGREVVDVALVLRELIETTRGRFKSAGIKQRLSLPDQGVLLQTTPTTLSRLFSDVILAGLAHCTAEGASQSGETAVRLVEEDEALRFDFLAVRGGSVPIDTPPWREVDEQMDLWNDLDTINLAVLQSMTRCLGGVLQADVKGARLHVRVQLPVGKAAIPLHAGVLSPYGPFEEGDSAASPLPSTAEDLEGVPSRSVAEEASKQT